MTANLRDEIIYYTSYRMNFWNCNRPCFDKNLYFLLPALFKHPSIHPSQPPRRAMSSSSTHNSSSRALRIGIIGFGPFAQFLSKTITKQRHQLQATSRTDHSQLCARMGITFFSDVGEFLESGNDVIMISTSILSLSEVLKTIPFHRLRRPTLFVDVLSVKEYPRASLLQVVPEDSDILCTHPMFGPESGKDGWEGLNFMYERVRVRDHETCSSFLQIFEKEGCRMLEMSCEKHDKLAARSQFIAHTIGRVLAEMDVDSTDIDTKGFESLVQLKRGTERDSFDLFSGLFIHNRFAKQELENLGLTFGKIKERLLQRMEEVETTNPAENSTRDEN
ncbi:arogenate dehydrogenase 1, chloroplastic-like [Punica granatum]|uniref:Arogenate dehydrogenase 1, chloroplastic-like n=1 Tax=Punica granatum TaxID=22663 RepID=A0A6P8BUF5_PUNGR|nr:arogenate dehydrogenase 1, chloroplastic-like [Punica granatum]